MKVFVFLAVFLVCSGGVLAVSLYPMNQTKVSLYVGERREFSFNSRNDQTSRDLTFFVKASNDNVKVNGYGTEDEWEDSLGSYEMTTQSFELKGMRNGSVVVTYGVKTSPGSSSGVGFVESVVKQLAVDVRCDGGVCSAVTNPSNNQSTGSSGSSGSVRRSIGGGGGKVQSQVIEQNKSIGTPAGPSDVSVPPSPPVSSDVVMSDVTPQQSGLSQMAASQDAGPQISVGNVGDIVESISGSVVGLSVGGKLGLVGVMFSSISVLMLAAASLRVARTVEMV